MKQQKKDDAVSPVVGVMLMLVVTIIIAAVVAAFAGGLGGNVEKTPTVTFDVTMDDNGLLLTCTGADTSLVYGKDFLIYINHPNALDEFTIHELDVLNTTSGYDYSENKGIAFTPGKSIYYSTANLTNAYLVLNQRDDNPNQTYNTGSNKDCWTWGGSGGEEIGLPVKVQLKSPSGQVLARAEGKCTRSN